MEEKTSLFLEMGFPPEQGAQSSVLIYGLARTYSMVYRNMSHSLRLAIVTLAISLAAGVQTEANPFADWHNGAYGYQQAAARQSKSGRPMMVYFYTDWCPNCRRFDREVIPAVNVNRALQRFVKVRINPERGKGESQLARQFGISGVPSVFVIPADTKRPQKLALSRSPNDFAKTCMEWVNAGRPSQATRPATETAPQVAEAGANDTQLPVTIMLKDGRQVTGHLIFEDAQEVILNQEGQLTPLNRQDIQEITRIAGD